MKVVYIWAIMLQDAQNLFTFWIGTIVLVTGFLQYAISADKFAYVPEFSCITNSDKRLPVSLESPTARGDVDDEEKVSDSGDRLLPARRGSLHR